MSFLDNLESNLKALESRDEAAAPSEAEKRRRDNDAALARAAAPFADRLKRAPFTSELLKHATRLGFAARTKVHIAWLGTTLRLEARERRLELRPTPEGVLAVFLEDGQERRTRPLDLDSNAEELAREWLAR